MRSYDVPVTREQVQFWIHHWQALPEASRPSLDQHIRDEMDNLGLLDATQYEGDEQVPVIQKILEDLSSYA